MSWQDLYKNNVLGACLATFGETEPVTYVPHSGPSYPIQGIFNEVYQEVGEAGAIVEGYRPNLGIRLKDLQAPVAHLDRVIVRSVTYRIINNEVDGEGGTTLILHVDKS